MSIKKQTMRLLLILTGFILLFYFYTHFSEAGFQYEWRWNRVWRYLGGFTDSGFKAGPLLKGIYITIGITLLGGLLAVFTGLIAAIFRLSPWPLLNFSSRLYISLWRGTPLLLQLFFAYFLISPLLKLQPFSTAVLALGLFEGAYLAEIFRAGLLSVPKSQWEASLSLGFGLPYSLFRVILPQAWANTTPALVNQAIAVLKDSSLVSAIAVADITMQSQAIVAETFMAFEVWLLAGAIYLALALFISIPAIFLERLRLWR